jgi:hypothetical protein
MELLPSTTTKNIPFGESLTNRGEASSFNDKIGDYANVS